MARIFQSGTFYGTATLLGPIGSPNHRPTLMERHIWTCLFCYIVHFNVVDGCSGVSIHFISVSAFQITRLLLYVIQDHERAYFDSADWALEKVFMFHHVKCIKCIPGRAKNFLNYKSYLKIK